MSTINYNELAKAAKAAAADCIAQARSDNHGLALSHGLAAVMVRDQQGARIGDPLIEMGYNLVKGPVIAAAVNNLAPAQWYVVAVRGEVIDESGDAYAYWEIDSSEAMTKRDKHKARAERNEWRPDSEYAAQYAHASGYHD